MRGSKGALVLISGATESSCDAAKGNTRFKNAHQLV
jgi:hypothetical protein